MGGVVAKCMGKGRVLEDIVWKGRVKWSKWKGKE